MIVEAPFSLNVLNLVFIAVYACFLNFVTLLVLIRIIFHRSICHCAFPWFFLFLRVIWANGITPAMSLESAVMICYMFFLEITYRGSIFFS